MDIRASGKLSIFYLLLFVDLWLNSSGVEHGTGGAEIKRLENIMLISIELYDYGIGRFCQ